MLNVKWTLTAAMLAAAITASAQTASYRGSFQLPFEARFGKTVLEPGSYKISTLEGARGIRITGENKTVTILAAGTELKPGSDRAKMILVDSGGMYALERFESGSMQTELQFLVVKNPRGAVERASVVKPTVEVGLQ
jgi:hypothetical protein